jgi:DNA topoisomerase-1
VRAAQNKKDLLSLVGGTKGMRRKKSMNKNGPKLLIVESPAKIKTISKFLGKDFRIMSTFGHIKDLPERRLGVTRNEKDNSLEIKYDIIKNKADVIADICKQAGASSEIFLASDPDREGEIISWHIGQEIEKVFADPSQIHRITFNEITKPAIAEAISHKSHVNMNMVNAQQARRILDRWVGYEVSPILWRKISKGLSAGRVQSVAVMLVCDREAEIVAFKPEEYWSVHGLFSVEPKAELLAELVKISNKNIDIKNKEEADKILAAIKKEQFSVSKITEKKRAKNPPPPFMTSTLQQDAYNKLGFSVDKTMSVAQKLYEGLPLADKNTPEALITYMRTDSLRISDTALDAVRTFIGKEFGKEYLPKQANAYDKKGAQDAHEAIRPIDVNIQPSKIAKYLKPEEAKLYELIWKRFVACQMEAAEYFQRQVTIEGGKFMFRATGSTLMFDGFLKVYLVEDEEEEQSVKIPKEVKEKVELGLKKLDPKQHFTQPPPRYTEATLVKELEKRGIGRPSTYAAILFTIQKRGYVAKEAKRFMPTELGKKVNDMLVEHLPDIVNVTFTAKMEEDLDKIAEGTVKRDDVLNGFYGKFKKDLIAFGGNVEDKKAEETDVPCPTCGANLVIRFSKNGQFIGCSKFPTCTFTSNFSRDAEGKITLEEKEQVEMSCPQCGKPMVKRMSRFGPFISCSGYPDCKYIHQEKLTMKCPSCKSDLVKRRWRGGSFWGCAGYPKCKFSIFGEVSETPCPKCKSPYLLVVKNKQDGTEKLVCPDKACGYTK